ncbi:MAG: extracellular solute-binding protein [Oscillospiraceae bacterium]|nr:extracellular solute-binding protein [Oscillospiraceae bacterium]
MKKLRSLLALLLAAVMTLSLAACGGKQEDAPENEDTEHTEYVYTAAYRSVSGNSSYMSPQIFTDDGFYVVSSENVGSNAPEGAILEYEGQYDVYESRLYFVGLDGSTRKLEGYEPLPAAENTDDYPEFYSGSGVSGMGLLRDGSLLVVENNYVSYFDGPESMIGSEEDWKYWQYTDVYYLRVLDQDGNELSRAEVEYETTDSYLNFYGMQIDEDDNVLCSGDTQIVAIAQDGSVVYTIPTDDYINSLVRLKDGRLGFTLYGESGMELHLIDTAAHSVGSERYTMPNNAYDLLTGGGDYDLYYPGGQSLYGYKLETEENERILNWLDVDINGNYMSRVSIQEDGSIVGVLNNYDDSSDVSTEIVTLSRVPYDSVPHKQELTLAVMDAEYNYELSNAIIRFNRSSDTCRVRVLDYAQYNTEDDASAGLTKLTTEIMSGNLPDLLCLNQLPYKQLAAKGFLEDLYPYLDADKELSRDDFFPTVLKGMEVEGKLCEITPTFAVSTLIGASSIVGDTPGWTYADFDAALAKMPAGCDPLDQYTTRDDILRTLVFLEMDDLVDWNTGKVNFDSQSFIDMLHFAARFPKEFNWDNYEWTDADQVENRISEGRQMLMNASIYYIDNIQYNDMYFGDDTTYIGYPTNNGVGNMIRLGAGDGALYAMSTKCSDKEAAWQFLRSFLTEDAQKDLWGLPTNVKAFNKQLEKAMTPEYRRDANGNYVLDDNGERIEVSRGSYGMADGSVHYLFAVTQEQADKLLEVINATTKVESYDDSIFDIVNEQAQAFFAGQKSAEEVARLIQSKANIYVNEQR